MNFAWAGQSCGSTSRILVHESLATRVTARLAERLASIRVGDACDPASEMGPLNSAGHLQRVRAHVARGCAEARLVLGGGAPKGERFARGYWLEPTLFTDVAAGHGDRARGSVRARDDGAALVERDRDARDRQRHALWPDGLGVHPGHRRGATHGARARERRGPRQRQPHALRRRALRRHQGFRSRRRGMPRRAEELHRAAGAAYQPGRPPRA